MASEVRAFDITVPAGTAQSAGWSADMSFPARTVQQVEVLVPPGPRGTVGFAIGSAGQPVMPRNAGAWIVSDDERIVWPLDGLWDSGAWTMFAYNNGQYQHTLYVTFLLDAVQAVSQPTAGSLPILSLNPPTPADNGGLPAFTVPALTPVEVPVLSGTTVGGASGD